MKQIHKIWCYIFIIFVAQQALPVLAMSDDANEIIKKVKAKFDGLETFRADFSQISYWKLADNVHQQEGAIWLKGKEKFKIETHDQITVSDGKTIWTHSKFNNQVIIDNINKTGGEANLPRDIFLIYSEQYQPSYLQNDKIEDQDCYVLELKSKTEDVFIKFVRLWINQKTLVPIKIEQIDLNNNTNTYLLKNIVIDKPLADNFFHYRIPESVEVIDMR